ncbi:MAG: type IV toxin-antitoxin system AbiEi family antitoxin domain-containing protein [Microbacterium sp.]
MSARSDLSCQKQGKPAQRHRLGGGEADFPCARHTRRRSSPPAQTAISRICPRIAVIASHANASPATVIFMNPLPQIGHHPAPRWVRTAQLREAGWTKRQIARAVSAGTLVRVRQGAYCVSDTPDDCVSAARVRGRLACVSELRRRGVFVRDRSPLHIHVDETASRLPKTGAIRVHRGHVHRTPHPQSMSVEVLDALIDAVRCQDPRAAIATVDSALHLRVIDADDLDDLFAALPRRYRRLCQLVDGSAESGPETFMRLILRALGYRFEAQVNIPTVGRVDFLVAGVLIVECDSRQFHSSWEAQREDRRRDMAAAALGFLTVRFVAEDILWHPEQVQLALRGLATVVRRASGVPTAG